MNKSVLQQITLQVFSVLLFFGLIYFWVEDKDLGKSIHSTIVYFVIVIIINAVRYLRKSKI